MNAWLLTGEFWLIDFACLSTALLAAAVVIRWLLRDAGGRVALAWGTWIAIAAGGVLIAAPLWPRYGLWRLLPQRPMAAVVIAPASEVQSLGPLVVIEPLEAAPSPADAELPIESIGTSLVPAKAHEDLGAEFWWRMVVGGWLASAAAAIFWILAGFGQAWMLVRRSKRAPQWIADELGQIAGPGCVPAEVRVSPELSSAVALGAIKPRVLLPEASAVESNAKAIRAALAHELAHIRHGDLWLLALERLLLPLLAVHPLFWWLRRSTRLDQELLADAAAAGEQPVEYAEALVAWAKAPASFNSGLAALAMWERPSNLSRRVHMILSNKRPGGSWLWRFCGSLAAIAVVCAGAALSTLSVRAIETDDGAADEPAPAEARGKDDAIEPADDPSSPAEPATKRPDTRGKPKNAEMAITLKVALLALDRSDFPQTRRNVIDTIERVTGRPMVRLDTSLDNHSGNVTVRTAEIDSEQSSDVVLDLHSIEGVKLISRAKIITLDGQEARIDATEPPARIEIEEEVGGKTVQRVQINQNFYMLKVKPRAAGNGSMLNIDVHVSRVQPQVTQPATVLKTTAQVGRTLIVVSSEPYAILITPVKVEPQVVSQSVAAGERDIGFPILPVVPAPPVRASPATTPVEAAPAVASRAPAALMQPVKNLAVPVPAYGAPAYPATTPVPIAGPTLASSPILVPGTTLPPAATPVPTATPAPVIPALPTTTRPQAGTNVPPPPTGTVPQATPVVAGPIASDGNQRIHCTIPINEDANEIAGKLRKRLQEENFNDVTVSSDPRTNSIMVECKWIDAQTIPNLLRQLGATFNNRDLRATLPAGGGVVAAEPVGKNAPSLSPPPSTTSQTQRKLLELDLAEAQVNVELAQSELESIQEISKKNPSAVSRQELRKRQLEVDRAKIQVKRIHVQLDAEEPAEPVIIPGR
jgi:hypothetical protein